MNFLYPLTSILGESAGKTLDKLNFDKNRIAPRQQMLLVFIAMTVFLSGYILLTGQPFPDLPLASVSLIALIVTVSFAGNLFDYLSLEEDDLALREPLTDFEPILAGLIGYALFPAERSPEFLVVFILSSLIVYWGIQQKNLQGKVRTGMMYFTIATVLYASQPSIYKATLDYINPEYIVLFRVAAILGLSLILFHVHLRRLSGSKLRYGLVSGFVYAIGAVAGLYTIDVFGVVLTALILLLGPAIRYLSAYFILRERVTKHEMISSGLLAVLVLTSLSI